jgi:succinyl-diaminopimelate desuccinylase
LRDALEAWIDTHSPQIIAATQEVLRIPSVKDPTTVGANAPFGRSLSDALDHTLSLCRDLGMHTENFAGFAGHAEFGAGDEIVAVLGHLDVVPVGKDWTYDPWGAKIQDGWIFARGSSDDKGPTFAALFGAKAVLDITRTLDIPLTRRVRLIFGCDEESEWKCMAHYFGEAGQAKPTVAFTPDADFPLVYAEKGSFTAIVEQKIALSPSALYIVSFNSGLRPNMVPDEATALLAGDADALDLAAHVLAEVADISVQPVPGGLLVHASGISAHGATPQEGVNAAVKLMRALTSNSSAFDALSGADFTWMDDLARRVAPDGSAVGIAGTDGIGTPLTSNLGIVTYNEGILRATFNIRYPVTWNGEETIATFVNSLGSTGWQLAHVSHTPSLYVPKDEEPVKTLLRVYREHTGDLREPHAIGGRTYATSVAPVGVAFGPSMAGDPDTAHKADERFSIERLLNAAKIYAHAIYELAK